MIRVGLYVASKRFTYDKYAIVNAYKHCRSKLRSDATLASSVEFVVDSFEDFIGCVNRCDVCFIDAENVSDKHDWWVVVARIAKAKPKKKFVIFICDDCVPLPITMIRPNVKFIPFDCIESCMEKEIMECTRQ